MVFTSPHFGASVPPGESLSTGDFRRFLQEELLRRCKINPRYSLRRFALRLGVDASLLSKLLSGKRPTGPKTIRRFGAALGLTPEEIESFVVYHDRTAAPKPTGQPTEGPDYRQLTEDTYRYLSDWHYYAILELMRTAGFRPNISWIGTRLGLKPELVQKSVDCLQRLELLKIHPDGRWEDLTGGRTTTLGHANLTQIALKTLQAQLLERAMGALADVPLEARNNTSITLAADPARVGAAKKMIREFQRDLAKMLSRGRGEKSEVYNLSVALFPLTVANPETERLLL